MLLKFTSSVTQQSWLPERTMRKLCVHDEMNRELEMVGVKNMGESESVMGIPVGPPFFRQNPCDLITCTR